MKNFDLLLPESLDEAIELLPRERTESLNDQRTRILAGGQDLLGELKDHLVEPDALVDVKRVGGKELGRELELGPSGARIGALVTVARLARPDVAELHPVLAEAAASIASPQIRTLATVGGNLCQRPRCWYYRNEHTACLKRGGTECFSFAGLNRYNAILGGGPSYIVHPSDLAPALVALDARVALRGSDGERELALEDFFVLPARGDVTRENVLAPDELVVSVEVPSGRSTADGWRSTYLKFKERGSFDWALSAVALALRLDGDRVADARLCLGGVAPVPWRCRAVEERLVGSPLDEAMVREAGELAVRGAEPLEDNGYKVPLTRALVTRALTALGG